MNTPQMELHFRNIDYVSPPGCLSEILSHPYFGERESVQLALFFEHRYAFFLWNKWTRRLRIKKDIHNPPCLITLDWHQDLYYPSDLEKEWLDKLDLSNNRDVSLHTWANLPPLNDGQIMAAAYLNLIGNIYVHCRQGKNSRKWKDDIFEDKYGNQHLVKKFKKYSELEEHILNSDETNVYFDIDIDFFTIMNPYCGVGKSFTYLADSTIKKMLQKERPLIDWIFQRLCGFTIAIEPEHSGGLLKANYYLDFINKLYFKPPLFSNFGSDFEKGTDWKHLKK